jgi:hypothetical protein
MSALRRLLGTILIVVGGLAAVLAPVTIHDPKRDISGVPDLLVQTIGVAVALFGWWLRRSAEGGTHAATSRVVSIDRATRSAPRVWTALWVVRKMNTMEIAGLNIRDGHVLELATMLRDAGNDTMAERLADAILADQPRINLTIDERETILRALFDPPNSELAELQGVLLQERAWRHANGL